MKTIKWTVLVVLLLLGSGLLAQTRITITDPSSGDWKSYNSSLGTPPSDWHTTCNFGNWQNPTGLANPDAANITTINGHFTSNGSGGGVAANNFIWAQNPEAHGMDWGNYVLTHSYIKYCLSIDESDCGQRFHVLTNADDDTELWVNGTLVTQIPFNFNVNDIDITDYLHCGSNAVAFKVTDNHAVKRYFVAEIYETTGTPPTAPNAVLTSNHATFEQCEINNLHLGVSGVNNAIAYQWTGPNGFYSTFQNPIRPEVAKPDEGTYTCRVTLAPCCHFYYDIEVTMPEDCCDTGLIEVDRFNCTWANLSVNTDLVSIDCEIWQVNGVTVDPNNVELQLGDNEICVYYFGKNRLNNDFVCNCNEQCTTITILPTVEQDTHITYCGMNPQPVFDFCDFAPPGWDHFIVDYNPTSGFPISYLYTMCEPITLGPGWYQYRFIDEFGCVLKEGIVTVTEMPIQYNDLGVYNASCGEVINYDHQLFHALTGCGNCTWTNSITGDPIVFPIDMNNEPEGVIISMQCFDSVNCCATFVSINTPCCVDPCFDIDSLYCETDPIWVDLSCGDISADEHEWSMGVGRPTDPGFLAVGLIIPGDVQPFDATSLMPLTNNTCYTLTLTTRKYCTQYIDGAWVSVVVEASYSKYFCVNSTNTVYYEHIVLKEGCCMPLMHEACEVSSNGVFEWWINDQQQSETGSSYCYCPENEDDTVRMISGTGCNRCEVVYTFEFDGVLDLSVKTPTYDFIVCDGSEVYTVWDIVESTAICDDCAGSEAFFQTGGIDPGTGQFVWGTALSYVMFAPSYGLTDGGVPCNEIFGYVRYYVEDCNGRVICDNIIALKKVCCSPPPPAIKGASSGSEIEEGRRTELFPNPTHGAFRLKYHGEVSDGSRVIIQNSEGRQLSVQDLKADLEFDLSPYPTGVYQVIIHNGEEVESHSIVLEK